MHWDAGGRRCNSNIDNNEYKNADQFIISEPGERLQL